MYIIGILLRLDLLITLCSIYLGARSHRAWQKVWVRWNFKREMSRSSRYEHLNVSEDILGSLVSNITDLVLIKIVLK